MKRIASVLLLTLLLFNWFGYRLVISFMEDRANAQLESLLDENKYDESQLVAIKIPVKYISYYSSSTNFERVDGEILFNGISYKYVKRRIFRDSLEVLCIPNPVAMNLKATQNEFFRFSDDLQQGKAQVPHPVQGKRFFLHSFIILDPFQVALLTCRTRKSASYYCCPIISRYAPTAEQPPDIG